QLDRAVTAFGDTIPGVVALVRLLGALMSTDALTRELAATASSIQAMLDPPAAEAALAQLRSAATTNLAELIATTDPNDPVQVATVVQPVAAFAGTIRTAADRLVGGMAFGEATLVGADLD